MLTPAVAAADDLAYDRKEDGIFGRKSGNTPTMDVFTPARTPEGSA